MKTSDIPITQSPAWAKLQDDLGEVSFLEKGAGYQYLAILKHTPVGNYLYLPYGPVYQDKNGFGNALKSLHHLAGRQHALFIRIEPLNPAFAAHPPKHAIKTKDLNPKETWLLDLTGTDEELKSRLPSRLLRYHKSASKKGLTIETSHDSADIHYLLDLQKSLAAKKGINTFSENYLKTELAQPFATLYLVKYSNELPENIHSRPLSDNGSERSAASPITDRCRSRADEKLVSRVEATPSGRPEGSTGRRKRVENESFSATPEMQSGTGSKVIAAGLVFDDKTTRYNLQGAQSDLGRRLHATGILTVQLIFDAKQKGLKTFDFWGIAPDGAPESHPWAGFTNFKKTFAGHEVQHSGTYDLVLSKPKYQLYKLLRNIRRHL